MAPGLRSTTQNATTPAGLPLNPGLQVKTVFEKSDRQVLSDPELPVTPSSCSNDDPPGTPVPGSPEQNYHHVSIRNGDVEDLPWLVKPVGIGAKAPSDCFREAAPQPKQRPQPPKEPTKRRASTTSSTPHPTTRPIVGTLTSPRSKERLSQAQTSKPIHPSPESTNPPRHPHSSSHPKYPKHLLKKWISRITSREPDFFEPPDPTWYHQWVVVSGEWVTRGQLLSDQKAMRRTGNFGRLDWLPIDH